MREFHVAVPGDAASSAIGVLEDNGVEYTTIEDDDEVHLFFPLPTAAVSTVLEAFEDEGLDVDDYTVVTKAEFARTPSVTDLQARYEASVRTLSTEELHSKIREIQWPYQLYYVGTVLSVIAATAGLFLDQPALVIGAMIIAPQASSALAAPAGVLLADWDLFATSVREQLVGLGVAVVGAAAFAWALAATGFVPPSLSVTDVELLGLRLAPTLLSTIGAIIAGVVGAFGYTTEQSTALIGVMIAAALIPAAAAIGIAVAWTAPLFGLGALLLLMVNLLAINLGALFTLLAMGYEPQWRVDGTSMHGSIPSRDRVAVYGSVLVLLLATAGTGWATTTNIAFARQVNQEVEATLDDQVYANVSLTGVRAAYGGVGAGSGPTNVTVTVARPTGSSFPALPTRLERRIEGRTGRDVRVVVEWGTYGSSNENRPAAAGRAAIPGPP